MFKFLGETCKYLTLMRVKYYRIYEMPSNCKSQENTTTVDRQKTLGTLKITSLKI
jgi:hypothetical protein